MSMRTQINGIILKSSVFAGFAICVAFSVPGQKPVITKGTPPIIPKPGKQLVDRRPDISFKPIVYLTKKEGDEIDPAKDRSVLAGKTISISKADGVFAGGGYMEAYFAVIVLRQGGKMGKPLDVRLEYTGPEQTGEPQITFAPNQKSLEFYFRLSLPPGIGKLRFTADPEGKLPESNKKNNSLDVTLNVAALNIVE